MADEVISFSDHFYILSTSPRIDDRTCALKHGDTFALFNRFGDIERLGTGDLGIYHQDTRFLSRLALSLEGERPLLLSSTIRDDNVAMVVNAMNPDIRGVEDVTTIRGSVHIYRSKFLYEATYYERIRIQDFGWSSVKLDLDIDFAADFADIFEVRGAERTRRGRTMPPRVHRNSIEYTYEGLDKRIRRTKITFEPPPTKLDGKLAEYDIELEAGGVKELHIAVSCEIDDVKTDSSPKAMVPIRYADAAVQANEALRRQRAERPSISTSNEQFDLWLNRSRADLDMMRTETKWGPYPYAGVPWFCTAFGRDGIITALECLSFKPDLAHGVLTYLAATQASEELPEQDAEPGKILHETRAGEMAALDEVPFRLYYGSIDSTPLFVMLAGAYFERTGDLKFAESIWPNVERALAWIDDYGDIDRDGFVEYKRRAHHGLIQQGWKDSHDSIFHADGALAEPPIALCEVQSYVYAGKLAAAEIAAAMGDRSRCAVLKNEAENLRQKFEDAFWNDDLSTYAIALDGEKRPLNISSSNAGHCLFTGIASHERAARVAATLTADAAYSGWGIRTVAEGQARYNPMSYHNGSIWPHDNALIAAGFARYGLKAEAARILNGFLDASVFFDLHRLPELFCGFERRPGESPILYPVACAPQAWASGAIFLLLESCLGLKIHRKGQRIVFDKPLLPPSLDEVSIKGLRVGDGVIDLFAALHNEDDVSINVLRREGKVDVVVLK